MYEIAQKLKMDVSFDIIKETGKDHKKVFVMECKLGQLSVTAEGTKKKEAKKAAAELMLERVHQLPGVPQDDYSVILKTKKKKKNQKKNKVVVSLLCYEFLLCCNFLDMNELLSKVLLCY